jgi:hypothetical protein
MRSGVLGDDGARMRIPHRQHVAGFDRFAIAGKQRRAVRNLVTLALATVLVMDQHFAAAAKSLSARCAHW